MFERIKRLRLLRWMRRITGWNPWALCKALGRKIRSYYVYLIVSVQVWWWLRALDRAFRRAAQLPYDDAMLVVTRWRWQLTHSTNTHKGMNEALQAAVDRLEQIVIQKHAQ